MVLMEDADMKVATPKHLTALLSLRRLKPGDSLFEDCNLEREEIVTAQSMQQVLLSHVIELK